jgi:nanoRNase/pAp phosphatase (c-di-AMP/oligoRNAs hydrolase)
MLTIVDHHRAPTPPKARFVDLRLDAGATATIFVEYLEELAPRPDVEEDRRIATALMHGLSTDTDDFMLARAADFRAAAQIAEVCDRDLLADLNRASSRRARWTSSRGASRLAERAAQLRHVRRRLRARGRARHHRAGGRLPRAPRGHRHGVVYGVVGDKFIEGSLRTHSPSVDPAVWLEQAFGTTTRGARTAAAGATRGASASPSASSGARPTARSSGSSSSTRCARRSCGSSGDEPTPGSWSRP